MPVKSQLSGLIVQLLGFRTIANDKFPVKKGIQSLRKAVVQLNIKLLAGRFLKQEKIYFTDTKTPWQIKTERDLGFKLLSIEQIKRVRWVRRADGYYVQFVIKIEHQVDVKPTGKIIGLDVGLQELYTDSNGYSEPHPRFYRKGEKRLKFRQRNVVVINM
jgi:putative transposase